MAETNRLLDTSMYPTAPANKLMGPGEQMQQLGQMVGVAQGVTGLQRQQFEQGVRHLNETDNVFGSIVTNPTMDRVTAGAATLKNLGVPDHVITQELGQVAQFGGDPQKIQQWALDHVARSADVRQKLEMRFGTHQQVNTGDALKNFQVNQIRGTVEPMAGGGAVVPNELSPQDRIRRVETVAPNGVPVTIPQGDISTNRGASKVGALPTGLGPTAAADAETFAKDKVAASDLIKGTRDLSKVLPILDRLSDSDTGKSSQAMADVKSFLVTQGIASDKMKDDLTTRQELVKYLNRYATQGPRAQRSDAAQLASETSNANVDLTRPAIRELVKSTLANDRMDAATALAFPNQNNPVGYGTHKSQFTQSQDTEAYRFDMMKPEEQKTKLDDAAKALKSGSPQEKDKARKFIRSLSTAHKTIFSAGSQ